MRRMSNTNMYSLHRQGAFGAFTLRGAETQSVFYTSTVFGIDELKSLETAKEVLSLSDSAINFDAIIQRDIIPDHVVEIEKYLSNSKGNEDVRFFPPLLVALLGFHNGTLDNFYARPDYVDDVDGEVTLRWGDVFQCKFGVPRPGETEPTTPITAPPHRPEISTDVIPYLTNLQINPSCARLVVVDGQHRLRALKELSKPGTKSRKRVESLTIPVCIVWPPWAYQEEDYSGPDVIQALRRIFVDVNHEGRKVSGHFKILLDDNDLAAIAVRVVCEHMRSLGLLQYVEWNQHQDNLAYQLTSYDKLTSVGLLHQAIKDSGAPNVGSRRDNFVINRNFAHYLQLDSVREEIDAASTEATRYSTITNWDRSFTVGQRDLLRKQMEKHFAPAVSELYRSLSPFSRIKDAIEEAIGEFDVDDNSDYQAAIEAIREQSAPEVKSVISAKEEIHSNIKEKVQALDGLSPSIYRTQRFQQGLFGAFYYFTDVLEKTGPSRHPKDAATQFVEYLNREVFSNGDRLFAIGAPWLENMVTQGTGAAIIKRKSTQLSVARLLLARLGEPNVAMRVAREWTAEEGDPNDLAAGLQHSGEDVAKIFISEYRDRYWWSVFNSLEFDTSVSEELREELGKLRTRAEGNDVTGLDLSIEEAKNQLNEKVYAIVDERTGPILLQFSRVLGYRPAHLNYIYPDADEWDIEEEINEGSE